MATRYSFDHAARTAKTSSAILLLTTILSGTTTPSVRGEITLDWDFDHGALNTSLTTITPAVITLGPRTDIYASRWIHCRASDVLGLDPQFRISNNYIAGSTLSDTHRYVYSYDTIDWYFFDNGDNDGSYYWFWNDTPFDSDEVWLAYALPYPLSYTEAHTAWVQSSPWVSPTPSADANFVIGLSNDGTLTDLGRPVPQHDMYGYLISDADAPGPKTVVVLVTGNHPNETTGTYTFQGMVDFLLSDDARAAALRGVADFYVYPQCNPDGRWAGHARTNPENPNSDHNRYWDNTANFTDLYVVTTAMQYDVYGTADYFIDFHSWNNPSNCGLYVYPEHTSIDFVQSILAREPVINMEIGTVEEDGTGVARHWAHVAEGLNCEYTFTSEGGFLPGWPATRYLEMGENYALALYDALVLAGCGDPPTDGTIIFAEDFDDGLAGQYWDLYTTSSDYTAEFAFDYGTHGIPPAPNTLGGTTTGVKFTVNNNDGVAQTEALCAYPASESYADDYVLKFDMWINYNGGAGGGSGSTEFMHAGINQSGTQVNWPENPASDGFSFAVTGEGGAARDYRAYAGATMFTTTSGAYVAGSQNHSASLYQSLFSSPPFETPGAPGKQWVEVAISQHKGAIEWRVDGTLISTRTDTSEVAGNVMIGYMDLFSSIANPAADNFIIYDNVRVEQLPETDCNGTGIPDNCESIAAGDFNADGFVDALDIDPLADALAGPDLAPTLSEPTCIGIYLSAFDFDTDGDIDLADVAGLQLAAGE